jgi:hypothetical protein
VGLTALGLPFAQDPAVTRHLAAFLGRQARADIGVKLPAGATFLHPSAILFNGGVFKDERLRERIASIVDGWLLAEGGKPMKRLEALSLDLAVAAGACYSGLAREGRGIRIRGGTARAYYVGVEAAAPAVPGFAPPVRAVCLAPFGMEEGSATELPQLDVGAVVGEHTSFRFFSSSVRREDQPGAVVDDVDDLEELPHVEATLPPSDGHEPGSVVPVGLRAAVTEVGTLELSLVERSERQSPEPKAKSPPPAHRWKLEFSVRED